MGRPRSGADTLVARTGEGQHMSMQRITWDELPAAAHAAVTEFTGTVHAATSAADGVNSGIAARLRTNAGDVFVKGWSEHRVGATLLTSAPAPAPGNGFTG